MKTVSLHAPDWNRRRAMLALLLTVAVALASVAWQASASPVARRSNAAPAATASHRPDATRDVVAVATRRLREGPAPAAASTPPPATTHR